MRLPLFLFVTFAAAVTALGAKFETKPNDPYFNKFQVAKAPRPSKLILKEGDRLAICGDSITEQKMYARIIETYLTVCVPELQITARQYGWSGEKADGFLRRMTNDVLRFHPTVATTCYGMNDHGYRKFEPWIGDAYRTNSEAIIRAFKANHVFPVQGSPGCIGVRPFWSKEPASADDMNVNLCELRNIGINIAKEEKVGFADVFWPMLQVTREAKAKYGDKYEVPGKDGVHPGWSGHVVMAYCFLKSLGLNGEIGKYTVNLKSDKASASSGHDILSCKGGEVRILSTRYPFCATGELNDDNSIRSGMTLVPFNQDLNRLILVVKGAKAEKYNVQWGSETRSYSAKALREGVNLAADFQTNPFSAAFGKVDAAVAAKQNFETTQIKQLFRSPEAQRDMEAVVAKSEKERTPLAEAIARSMVPVTHVIKITAAN